jgi:hypothetical protein
MRAELVNTNVEGGVGIEMAGLAGSGAVRVMEVGWSSEAALRGVVSNHRALRSLTAVRGERHGKGASRSASGVDRECDVMSRGASGCSEWRIGGVDAVTGRVSRRSSRRGMRSG